MNKRILIKFVLLFFCIGVFANEKSSVEKSNLKNIYIQADSIYSTHLKKAEVLVNSCLKMINVTDTSQLVADVLTLKAKVCKRNNKLDSALYFSQIVLGKYNEKKACTDIIQTLNLIANIYLDRSDLYNAIEFFSRMESKADSCCQPENKIKAQNGLGICFFYSKNYARANEMFVKAFNWGGNNRDTGLIVSTSNNLGNVYSEWEPFNYDSAAYFYKQGLQYVKNKQISPRVNLNLNLGILYLVQNDYKNAEQYLYKSKQIAYENEIQSIIPIILFNISSMEIGLNKFNKALATLNECEIRAKEIQVNRLFTQIYESKANVFSNLNLYDSALNNMLIANQWRDSIWNDELINTTQAYEEKIAFQKQKTELELKEMEIEQQKAILKANKYGIVSLIVALITAFCIVVMVYIYLTKVKRLNLHLSKVINTKNRIMSIIAHDIRSPLGGINSLSELMLNPEIKTDEKDKYIEQIYSSSSSVLNLLNNLLEWYNAQEKKIQVVLEEANIYSLVATNTELLAPMAIEKRIGLINQVEDELLIKCDIRSVNTIIRNILSNAIKFSPDDGRVQIWAEKKESIVILHIKDEGIGMDKNQIANLFSKDVVKGRKGSQNAGSFGLGLILCDELVKLNNGAIHVDSALNKGTCISIELPLCK